MPTSIIWHPELKNVLVMELSGTVTMDDVLDITMQEGELIKASREMVQTIIDLRTVHGIPKNFLSAIPRITSMPAANHPLSGEKIVVGASGLAESFLNIFSKVGRKITLFKTMEEAVAYLKSQGN